MIDPYKKFDVPWPYLTQRISKEARVKLFKSIVDGYKKRYPHAKVVLAYLNWDPKIDIDFLLIFRAENHTNDKFVLFDLASFGSRHSIPGYRYCIQNDKVEDYFEDSFKSLIPIEMYKFGELIVKTLGLSLIETDPNFWKKAENVPKTIDHLRDISIRFVPQQMS